MIPATEVERPFRQLLRSFTNDSFTRLMPPGNALQRKALLMIMRSVNDDGFDLWPNDPAPPLLSAENARNRISPNWRFVRLDSAAHQHIDQFHAGIAAPHIRQTPAAAVPESEFNKTIYFG
jgi:hypothetical protein